MIETLSGSDWVLICTTAILAIVAFTAPFVVWRQQRKYLAPKLNVSYLHDQPMSRLSSRSVDGQPIGEPFFDFHFQVLNEGRSPAKRVEAVIEELWIYDASGKPVKQREFWPVNLRYDPHTPRYVDINPKRPYFWNIGNIPSANIQAGQLRDSFIDVYENASDELRFVLDTLGGPFYQANAFLPGTYGIKIALYSENASKAVLLLKIFWSGEWRDTEEEMFRQIVIEEVAAFS
jgi:hypothetical protein